MLGAETIEPASMTKSNPLIRVRGIDYLDDPEYLMSVHHLLTGDEVVLIHMELELCNSSPKRSTDLIVRGPAPQSRAHSYRTGSPPPKTIRAYQRSLTGCLWK